ncbi:hypothetical protein PENVUL_c022G09106 [Penicillium vulpinum]|uniref:Uncharacterized protein n=1 Tax=Penicillium vulpinum TaxID=29845 RepID=A0A1V6RV57_9EURO|nr:hypothetical protein PENVUL_c022G09106 [Penicillium vulpinum]
MSRSGTKESGYQTPYGIVGLARIHNCYGYIPAVPLENGKVVPSTYLCGGSIAPTIPSQPEQPPSV